MADYNWLSDDDDDDEDSSSQGNDIGNLRKSARRTARENKELKERLAAFEARERERTIADTVKELNLNPKIAKLVPKDVPVDQLGDFLREFTDVFGSGKSEDSGAGSQETPGSAQQQVADETLDPNFAALQRIQRGQSLASTPSGDLSEMLAKIQAAQSEAELNMILHGNPDGPMVF